MANLAMPGESFALSLKVGLASVFSIQSFSLSVVAAALKEKW